MDAEPWHFAMRLLPARKRADVRSVVEGCLLIRQGMMTSGCCSGGASGGRAPVMLEDVLRRYAVPREVVSGFVDACAADAATTRYATWSALRRHCEGVGGNVAVMVASVLGVTHSEALLRAIVLGAGMRMTEILRELARDLAAGRVYLPIEELVRRRVSERALLERTVDDAAARQVVEASVARARQMLREGGEGLPWVAPDGSRAAAGVIIAVTAARLDEIERAGARVLHQPVGVSALRLLRRLGDTWRMAQRRSVLVPRASRTG